MKQRNLIDVIDKMIEAIPESQVYIIDCLNDLRGSVDFSSPESISFWWSEVSIFLSDNIDLSTDWGVAVQNIFTGKSWSYNSKKD